MSVSTAQQEQWVIPSVNRGDQRMHVASALLAGLTRYVCGGRSSATTPAVDYRADDFQSALDAACPRERRWLFDDAAGPISDSVIDILMSDTGGDLRHGVHRELGSATRAHGSSVIFSSRTAHDAGFGRLGPCSARSRGTAGAQAHRDGQIRYLEDVLDGIEQAPGSMGRVYHGDDLGKRMDRIAPDVQR